MVQRGLESECSIWSMNPAINFFAVWIGIQRAGAFLRPQPVGMMGGVVFPKPSWPTVYSKCISSALDVENRL